MSSRFFTRLLTSPLTLGVAACTTGAVAANESIRKRIRNGLSLSAATPSDDVMYSAKWDFNWDRREPEELVKPYKNGTDDEKLEREEKLKKAKPTARRIIVLIRHGQYNDKADDDENRYLTELGKEQAALTGKRLGDLYEYFKTRSKDENGNQKELKVNVVKSTMTRATETADIILKNLPEDLCASVTSCDLIREGAPIAPEPPCPPNLWDPEPSHFWEDGARIEAGFRKYIHRSDAKQQEDTVDILVCHGNVIRYFVCRALQLPPEAWLRMSVHNGSITVLSVTPSGKVNLSAFGEAGHFPTEKLTFN